MSNKCSCCSCFCRLFSSQDRYVQGVEEAMAGRGAPRAAAAWTPKPLSPAATAAALGAIGEAASGARGAPSTARTPNSAAVSSASSSPIGLPSLLLAPDVRAAASRVIGGAPRGNGDTPPTEKGTPPSRVVSPSAEPAVLPPLTVSAYATASASSVGWRGRSMMGSSVALVDDSLPRSAGPTPLTVMLNPNVFGHTAASMPYEPASLAVVAPGGVKLRGRVKPGGAELPVVTALVTSPPGSPPPVPRVLIPLGMSAHHAGPGPGAAAAAQPAVPPAAPSARTSRLSPRWTARTPPLPPRHGPSQPSSGRESGRRLRSQPGSSAHPAEIRIPLPSDALQPPPPPELPPPVQPLAVALLLLQPERPRSALPTPHGSPPPPNLPSNQ